MPRLHPVARSRIAPSARTGNQRVATLYCAEPLRAAACCVCDALAVRQFRVGLQTGDAARAALRGFRDPDVGLRVLCVAEPVDEATRTALCRALDPYDRKDLLVIQMTTPLEVVHAIETALGVKPRRKRRVCNRFTRSYLSHQTLVERPVEVRRWSVYGIAGAMVSLATAAILHLSLGPRPADDASQPASAPAATEHIAQTPSRLVDDTVLSATQRPEPEPDPAVSALERGVAPGPAPAQVVAVASDLAPLEAIEAPPRRTRSAGIPVAGQLPPSMLTAKGSRL